MPADTTRLFVALRPDGPLDGLIRGYKRRLLAAAGPQMYASDPPHVTLYLAEFAAGRIPDVIRAAGQLAGQIEAPAVALHRWHTFAGDPLTGLNTLVCRCAPACSDRLRLVQLRVLDALAPLHDPAATLAVIAPRWPALAADERRRATLFGFPYVGGGWMPHLTIASVRPSEWPHVAQVFNLSEKNSGQIENQSYGTFTALDVFELHGLEPRPLAAFPLAARPIGKAA